jgi:poly(3-hydroxybutyrate) depolymerase
MDTVSRRLIYVLTLLALASCGGGGSGNGNSGGPAPGPVHGTLLQDPPHFVALVSAPDLLLNLGTTSLEALAALSVSPVCDVAIYHLDYTTLDGAGEATISSGALMVPVGIDPRCHGERPIMLYAHGTSTDRNFDISDLLVQKNAEGTVLAALFVSQGYIVVAPNYAGYDTSTLDYHPFINAKQQSGEMIDALTAARIALPASQTTLPSDNGQLFITGYSEGGFVAMATHRAMQAAGMTVTASAPMSGPYAIAAFDDAVFAGEVNGGAPISATLQITGYQRAYGDIYTNATDVFAPQYAGGIETLLPSTSTRSEIYAAGELPEDALFDPSPPAPQFAGLTPATSPANLAEVFALGFGTGNLIINNYRLQYLMDAQAHPDGGWPNMTTGVPSTSAALPLRQAAARNDLRTWVPTAPMLLCGGDSDPQVFWLNTQLMQSYWSTSSPSTTSYRVLDIDAGALTGGPDSALTTAFAVAKAAVAADAISNGATDFGAAAVLEAYHAELVAPFCAAAVELFFSSQ